MKATHYLAIDLGAESGRILLGTLESGKLSLTEIHRFPNQVITSGESLFWDLARLEKEIFIGIDKAAAYNLTISSISTDSWAVDYVLLNIEGAPLTQPHAYRDQRTAQSPSRLFSKLPFSVIYAETGIQFLLFNTIFQFESELHTSSKTFKQADHFLTIADYFNARLSGVEVIEESQASTTQLYQPRKQAWSEKLIGMLGLSPDFFPRIVPSGTVLGPINGLPTRHPALAKTVVIASCSHDTGAAVAAVPAGKTGPWAYLSSGTWSLLGAELPSPVMTDEAREACFTNEVGLGGSIRFLKNLAGLWLVQECRRAWESEGRAFTYDDLTRLAVESGPARAHLSLDDPRFLSLVNMPETIAAHCREHGQPVPKTPGQFIRTILESLALCYAQTLTKLETLIGQKIQTLHIVGGGSRNNLLNQLTADAVGRPVVAGPVEATAIGNILIQALALGHLTNAEQLRLVVESSFPSLTFVPSKICAIPKDTST